jgi:hypothetical protein
MSPAHHFSANKAIASSARRGSDKACFYHGMAKETADPGVAPVSMSKPGIVLTPGGIQRAFRGTLQSGGADGLKPPI